MEQKKYFKYWAGQNKEVKKIHLLRLRGFTLIELLVSVAIFIVVMVIALGALLAIAAADRKAETLKSVMNNLNFALESMSRSLRTGSEYNCGSSSGGDCTSGASYIKFIASNGDDVEYRFGSGSTCSNNFGCIERRINGNSGEWQPITSSEVKIESMSKFYVIGSEGTPDKTQPKVTIVISGYVEASGIQKTKLNLQTTVTQRLYDI